MHIQMKIKSLVLGAAILPTVLWAAPGDPLRFTSTREKGANFDSISLHVAADADPKPVFEYRTAYFDQSKGDYVWKDWAPCAGAVMVPHGGVAEMRAATDSLQKISGFTPTSSTWGIYNVHSVFSFDGPFMASGDVTTLLCRNGTNTVGDAGFAYLFYQCGGLKSAPELPAVNLSTFCYAWMFEKTAIEAPPALPAERLADRCYLGMFNGCANLKSAPVLRATELADWCYQSMFTDCSSLETAPTLSATNLKDQCYSYMFKGCSSLTAAPDLPATSLATNCYEEMFMGCTALANAPSLPATDLMDRCYLRMFCNCSSLETAPELPATTMKSECYAGMFAGCKSLAAAPELPSKDLASYCYENMFQGCTALVRAPELPSDWVVSHCYAGMFSGCTNLTEAPLLPAEDLALLGEGCYANMFNGCTSLTNVTLKAKWQTLYCFSNWLAGVAPQGTILCLKALELPADSASGVPSGWTREDIALPSPISGVEESYSFVAGAAIEPIVPTVAEGWSVKVTGLPSGLKAASGTGVVTGTPTAKPNTYSVTFTATKPGEEDAIVTTEITVRTVAVTVAVAGTGTGKVTGAGECAVGKKVTLKATADTKDAAATEKNPATVKSVFAGWYLDAKCETAADFGVDWRTPSVNYTATDEDVTVYAKFIAQTDDVAAVSFALPSELTNGVTEVNAPVDVSGCTTLPTVKVTGLPTGLKFTAKDILKKGSKTEVDVPANTIYGTPTKSGVYTVVATVTTAGKRTASASQTVVVRKDGEYVVKADVPAIDGVVPGKVTGMGVYAKDKKVTLKASANKGYVFSGWYDGDVLVSRLASYVLAMPESDVSLTAEFVTAEADAGWIGATVDGMPFGVCDDGGEVAAEANVSAGVYLEWPVSSEALSATTVKVAGLPSGLKFTAKDIVDSKTKAVTVPANTIYGVPTAASKANKPSEVKVTVTTAGKAKAEYVIELTVDPLPDYAVGTYNGALYDADTNAIGTVTLTVTAKGAASGKIVDADGVTWTVKAASYVSTDETMSKFYADLPATAKVGGETAERVFRAVVTCTDCGGRVEASEVDGETSGGEFLSARQDLWKGAYKEDGAKLFKTGKSTFRVFEDVDVEAEGLEEGQSLALKVEPSGKVTATLKGGAYVPIASATLVPLTRAGLPMMDAEATFVFLPKAAKNFSGQAVKATIKGIEDPAGPPAPVTRSWAGGTYGGGTMPMVASGSVVSGDIQVAPLW